MEKELGIETRRTISPTTFDNLVTLRKQYREAKSQNSPETAELFGSWCRAFTHAVKEGRKFGDRDGLKRLGDFSPETSKAVKKYDRAITDLENAAKNEEAARLHTSRIGSSVQAAALA